MSASIDGTIAIMNISADGSISQINTTYFSYDGMSVGD